MLYSKAYITPPYLRITTQKMWQRKKTKMENKFTLPEKILYEVYPKIHPAENRCWWTCFSVIRKLKASEKKQVRFIEGKIKGGTHYWLEVEGLIFDPHFEILCLDDGWDWDSGRELGGRPSDEGRVVEKVWTGDQIKIDWETDWEPRWSETLQRVVRVRQLIIPEVE